MFGLGPRLLKVIFLSTLIVGVEAAGPIQVNWGVCGLRYHHFTLRARGVTPCDTSHDVAPTPDFSGSDDETKAQAPARGSYLMMRRTDGAEGAGGRPGRRRTGLEDDAISGPILRLEKNNTEGVTKRFLPETPSMKSRTGQTFSEMGADLSNALKMGREGRHEKAGLHTWKGSKAA
ncbi:hypothetical protein THAOC_12710 [Thalassiosira oceanica]|uniref:Uncharacterized protein n=1 Tax=Thalassiosira oceanica TaxID=159749 RepID=K0SJE2_THAOC|nr:hypothetical protein THAOC_12710 [Thalassiosira oceanica]|eukprot:EJK66378.1 hypothetical protein THAOC_12710 [Thalassiosira oceanica]